MSEIQKAYQDITIDFELNATERAILSSAVHSEWFSLIMKLMEQEIREMNIRLLNTPTEESSKVLARHAVAQAAGMFFSGFKQRIEEAVTLNRISQEGIGTKSNPEEVPLMEEFE